MDTLLHDLRDALRALRESPGFSAAAMLSLAAGVALALALLSVADSGVTHPLRESFADGAVRVLRAEGGEGASETALPGFTAVVGAAVPADRAAQEVPWSDEAETITHRQRGALIGVLASLGAATLLALGVAVGDVMILLLARATARRQEMTLRRAVGASRARLLRQSLLEAALLAVTGCGLGVVLGAGALALLGHGWPEALALSEPLGTTPRAWLLALGVPLVVVLAVGLTPLLLTPRRAIAGALMEGRREGGFRGALAVLAVAASVVLLSGAGVMLRGSAPRAAAAAIPETERTLTLRLDASAPRYADPRTRAALYEAVLARAGALPGAEAQSLASPGSWEGLGTTDRVRAICEVCVRGEMILAATEGPARHHAVSPGYFDSLGIRVVRGREFAAGDRFGAPAVAVINEAFAHRLFPNVDPLGKQVRIGGEGGSWHTVVGVVSDPRVRGLGSAGEPQSAIYLSALQHPPLAAALAVRFDESVSSVAAPALQRTIEAVAPGIEFPAAETLAAALERFAEPLRWFGRIFAALGAAAVLLAAGGLFAVVAYLVSQRTREIGVRRALGARRRDVLTLVLVESARLVASGAWFGVLGALGLARVLQVLFYGVRPLDPPVYVGVALLLGVVALAGSIAPARRAAHVTPAAALRCE